MQTSLQRRLDACAPRCVPLTARACLQRRHPHVDTCKRPPASSALDGMSRVTVAEPSLTLEKNNSTRSAAGQRRHDYRKLARQARNPQTFDDYQGLRKSGTLENYEHTRMPSLRTPSDEGSPKEHEGGGTTRRPQLPDHSSSYGQHDCCPSSQHANLNSAQNICHLKQKVVSQSLQFSGTWWSPTTARASRHATSTQQIGLHLHKTQMKEENL